MKFILQTHVDTGSIRNNSDQADFSNNFALKAYLLALTELGSIELIHNPACEVDPIFENCLEHGERCVFLSFAPPHKTLIDLKCPTVPIVSCEFSNIPDEIWDDDSRNDWRSVFAKLGRAIALSNHTAQSILTAMGPQFPVRAITAPAMQYAVEPWADSSSPSTSANIELVMHGYVVDTINGLSTDSILFSGAAESFRDSSTLTAKQAPEVRITVDGIIYTSVLNLDDGRKNWGDLVTAFCWAFRDTDDATLILKIVRNDLAAYHNDVAAYLSPLFGMLLRLSPFKCRVIVLHGFLNGHEYRKLIGATKYYVNTSKGEGLCLPIMEFMACGKPAIAPAHTAMADYIDSNVAVMLRASLQPDVWPHDPRERFRTSSYRLNWESLLDAYRMSYRLVKHAPENYNAMGERARQKMNEYCSVGLIRGKLRNFFELPDDSISTLADDGGIGPTSPRISPSVW